MAEKYLKAMDLTKLLVIIYSCMMAIIFLYQPVIMINDSTFTGYKYIFSQWGYSRPYFELVFVEILILTLVFLAVFIGFRHSGSEK